jgi:hypothetical protein
MTMADLDRLRLRSLRAFPTSDPAAVLGTVRAIIGAASAFPPTEQGHLAATALSKIQGLQEGDPTPTELAALELMIRMTRPAPLVHNDTPDAFKKPEQSTIFPRWPEFQEAIKPFMPTVGRIDSGGPSLASSDTVGTGVLVGRNLLLTNRHVLMDISHSTGVIEAGMAVVRFSVEDDDYSADDPRNITGVAATHPTLDAVLLTVENAVFPAYATVEGPADDESDIVVTGYPSENSDRNPLFLKVIFGDTLGVLRAAPGQITGLVPQGFTHDCSTLGGNSGSPVFSMARQTIIGLHAGGSFLWNNQAIAGDALTTMIQSALNSRSTGS